MGWRVDGWLVAEICFTLLNGRLLLFRRFGIGSVEYHEATAIR